MKTAHANTFQAIAEEYIEGQRKKGLAEVTIEKKEWILIDLLCPKIGSRPISEIRPKELLEALQDLEGSGRLETTRRARQNLGAVFRLAMLTDRPNGDPTTALQRTLKAPKVKHHPAIINERAFGELMRKIDGYSSAVTRLALQFQALTFQRPIELRLAKWQDINLESSVWTIPEEHTKMRRVHDVPLSAASRAVLKKVSKIVGMKGFLFPSYTSRKRPISENTMNQALESLGYKGRHTSHGFRSSASSILNERGFREQVVESQLAHLDVNETRRAYNRAEYWDERVALMDSWSQLVAKFRALI